ncbi:MAG: zinc-ribbon domain containing protein [Clostridia bacterium]|nr:zinc-ribbon domain containing protein [Clostridia bacterium]
MEQAEVAEEKKEEVALDKQEEKKPAEPKDITLKCKKCENEFVWTVKDQEFYKSKGFFRPSYCKDCRKKMKVVNNFHKQ